MLLMHEFKKHKTQVDEWDRPHAKHAAVLLHADGT